MMPVPGVIMETDNVDIHHLTTFLGMVDADTSMVNEKRLFRVDGMKDG